MGSSPTAAVATVISRMIAESVPRRPSRSPKWPNRTPPKGRETNATPSTAKVPSRSVTWSPLAKKAAPIWGARKP
ncbi:hypothetical protein LUX73_14785 [Actinomadura madurae]|nr:hypothetical protein [Actinomadura madurae]MCQ0005806.1 hypothetical protein [Actinomadura madurae]